MFLFSTDAQVNVQKVVATLLPPQCTSYTVNNDTTRNIATPSGTICDKTFFFKMSPTWVRFQSPAGTIFPTSPPATNHCNTAGTGWISTEYPSVVGSTVPATICYNSGSNKCAYSSTISVILFTILHTYLGLNQPLNQILLNKSLNLLTDFSNANIFQQISKQLLSINSLIDKDQLSKLLQPLICFHLQEKYIQLDDELKIQFYSLYKTPLTMKCIKHIESLILTKGARQDPFIRFNFTKAVNQLLLSHINDIQFKCNSCLQLFKILLVSNPSLSTDLDDVGNAGFRSEYFLLHNLYSLEYYHQRNSSKFINMKCY
ncbi:unnamed protein product [Adineta steineri]|uniref:Uncharacterized protein n=1 Tax=Adineta steineri TaxID=433720 RepID=A0A815CKU8_9BILA|nr:unnamed protein product [Adineta steineri]CAF1281664.1 unnamed protein product [Adineta steineri]